MKKTVVKLTILFVWLLIMVFSCSRCKKEESPDPNGTRYQGTLSLEYSRTFPQFSNKVEIQVVCEPSGTIALSAPAPVTYSVEEEKDLGSGKMKLKESGSLSVSALSGKWNTINGVQYLEITQNTMVQGHQQTWAWTGSSWMEMANEPFSVENPCENPLRFDAVQAQMAGATIGKSIPVFYGNMVFQWKLVLIGSH